MSQNRLFTGLFLGIAATAFLWVRSPRAADNPAAPLPVEHACRVFPLNIEDGQGGYFETSDRTGSIGEWVGQKEDHGWTLQTLDYETSQKPTGFPITHVMICMSRPRT